MNNISSLCFMIILLLCMAGCVTPTPTATHADDLNLNDLTYALRMNWWNIEIPSEYDANDIFEIQLKSYEGETFYGCTGLRFKGGEKIKLLVWPSEDKTCLNTAIIASSFSARSSTTNVFTGNIFYPIPNGRIAQIDDLLMKGSRTKGISHSNNLKEEEFGLSLTHVQDPH